MTMIIYIHISSIGMMIIYTSELRTRKSCRHGPTSASPNMQAVLGRLVKALILRSERHVEAGALELVQSSVVLEPLDVLLFLLKGL